MNLHRDILREWADDDDQLRPVGQAPDDDHLEHQAREQAQQDRAYDHTPLAR